ncbi:MAG: 4Fe-4S dicluster domain-containing protein [Proteobacteria bacterium]|nr:4Fe-4S dicluster domain-containing protein [Pseudomonadota bacterium]
MKRREFLVSSLVSGGALITGALWLKDQRFGQHTTFVRPPGALDEALFLKRCIGCAKCVEACNNDCIRLLGPEATLARLHTPVIVPRRKGCTLCMACTSACPTGALKRIQPSDFPSRDDVRMGLAELNQSLCFSYNGRTCGVCYQACPLQGKAMTVGLFEQPTVNPSECVGCGLCEQACVHLPQAIRVRDRGRFA